MRIRFMKTHPDAVAPIRAHDDDAGFDLVAVSVWRVDDLFIYDTGIALEIPRGYFGGVHARSSIFLTGMEKCGGVTIVDSGYRGPVKVAMRRVIPNLQLRQMRGEMASQFPGRLHMMTPYRAGDRIAQLIVQPCVVPVQSLAAWPGAGAAHPGCALESVEFVEAAALSETTRGAGGYGSTGR